MQKLDLSLVLGLIAILLPTQAAVKDETRLSDVAEVGAYCQAAVHGGTYLPQAPLDEPMGPQDSCAHCVIENCSNPSAGAPAALSELANRNCQRVSMPFCMALVTPPIPVSVPAPLPVPSEAPQTVQASLPRELLVLGRGAAALTYGIVRSVSTPDRPIYGLQFANGAIVFGSAATVGRRAAAAGLTYLESFPYLPPPSLLHPDPSTCAPAEEPVATTYQDGSRVACVPRPLPSYSSFGPSRTRGGRKS